MQALPRRGLIIGKFYPPHKGHHYLIHTALKAVESLDVILTAWKAEEIPATLRAQWLREIHPEITVHILDQDAFDKTVAQAWADATLQLVGEAPHYIFSSEEYGSLYAELLKSTHIMVDKERVTIPCSASDIRRDPKHYLHFLEPIVQTYFL